MNKMIESANDLVDYFHRCGQMGDRGKQLANKGVLVSTAIRQETLISVDQGRVTVNGHVKRIEFENKAGGVWRAYLKGVL